MKVITQKKVKLIYVYCLINVQKIKLKRQDFIFSLDKKPIYHNPRVFSRYRSYMCVILKPLFPGQAFKCRNPARVKPIKIRRPFVLPSFFFSLIFFYISIWQFNRYSKHFPGDQLMQSMSICSCPLRLPWMCITSIETPQS